MYSRCEAKHGKGNCQKNGAIVYPKCKPGYHNFGCCICRPPKPNCKALGMNGGLDLSCAKKLQIGKPHSANCPPEKNTMQVCVISVVEKAIMVLDLFAGQKAPIIGLDVEWVLPKRRKLVLKLLSVK